MNVEFKQFRGKKKKNAQHGFQHVNIRSKVPPLSDIRISRAIASWWKDTS